MAKYQHILLAIDVQPESQGIALRALELAEGLGARISLLHVVQSPFFIANDSRPEYSNISIAKQHLQKLGRTLVIPLFDQHIALGDPQKKITEIAGQLSVDLLLLDQGREHASNIIQTAACDVMVMSDGEAVTLGSPCAIL